GAARPAGRSLLSAALPDARRDALLLPGRAGPRAVRRRDDPGRPDGSRVHRPLRLALGGPDPEPGHRRLAGPLGGATSGAPGAPGARGLLRALNAPGAPLAS